MEQLDQFIDFLQQPFFMMIGGLIFWFTLLWSLARNKNINTRFFRDQKDEMIVTLIGGLLFLLFTEAVLSAWDWIFSNEEPTKFHCFFFLLVGPAIERIYKLFSKK